MTKDELMRASLEAKRMIDNGTVQLVLERMRQDYVHAWLNTDFKEAGQREQAWCRVKVLEDFMTHMTILAENGTYVLPEQNF